MTCDAMGWRAVTSGNVTGGPHRHVTEGSIPKAESSRVRSKCTKSGHWKVKDTGMAHIEVPVRAFYSDQR